MKRAAALAALLALACGAGCKRVRHPNPDATLEEPAELEPWIYTADPRAATQLLDGWHGVEGGAWRWTMKRFSLSLRPPAGAARKGAVLEMNFSLPEAAFAKTGGTEIAARAGGTALKPFAVKRAGEHVYEAAVPASAMQGEGVIVEFELTRAAAPGVLDARELGLVVSRVGLVAQ
jgi:hypothetical protein